MSATILLAARDDTERAVLEGVNATRDLKVMRRCADLTDLMAGAAAGVGQLAIIDADFVALDIDMLMRVMVEGCVVIMIGDAYSHPELVAAARDAGTLVAQDVPEALSLASQWANRSESEQLASSEEDRAGRVIAVWGPAGAPGRTTLAIEIAASLARRNHKTLLIDADSYGGMVAPAMGLLDETPGLIAASRLAAQGRLTPASLVENSLLVHETLRVLVGIPRAERWIELPATALDQVWKQARRSSDYTVIDCGFNLERDEELMFDSRAPQRNAATLSALENADTVAAVGSADPLGIPRFVKGVDELKETVNKPIIPFITRVRDSVAGKGARASVREVLARFAGLNEAMIIPDDRDGFDAALLNGKTLADVAPQSPALKEIERGVEGLRRKTAAVTQQ